MKITFLGTACMQPTKERNHPGFILSYNSENILFDCGEGIQRQMKTIKFKPTKITRLLISHWHGDHVLGIPGLMQTMGASEYSKKLYIYGPKGTKENIKSLNKVFAKHSDIIEHEVIEINNGKFFENSEFILESYELEHGIDAIGFKFIEKDKRKLLMNKINKLQIPEGPLLGKLQQGKDITYKKQTIKSKDVTKLVPGKIIGYISDTAYTTNCTKIAENCDILVSESSFTSKHQDKAEQYKHLTSKEAAEIANLNNVKKLILTHISQRYKDLDEMLSEAKETFPNTILAHDFMTIKI